MTTIHSLGHIQIDRVDDSYIRMTVKLNVNNPFDEIEAEGFTIEEALEHLNEQVQELM
jgi:hypothetical protein